MQIIPFRPDHLVQVTPQGAQATAYGIDRDTAESIAMKDLAFSAIESDLVVGCAGVVPLWPGVGQAWAVLSDDALSCPVSLTRSVLRELARIEADLELQRVQATVADGHVAGRRWLAWLGFEVEGLMRNYGPGGVGDYWLYGRAP